MPMSQRTDRLDELLRQEIGAMLEREIADPRIGFATVTSVETDPDLRHARVWVSIIGGTAERSETLVALDHAMVFIRRSLGTRLRLKRIPDLHVRLDDSIERGTRVLQLLDAIETGHVPGYQPARESLPTPSRGAAPPGVGAPDVDPATVESSVAAATEGDGFGAAAAEYAASLAASLAARREDRKAGRSGGRPGAGGPHGARPGHGPGGGPARRRSGGGR
jgi:ribosome-binding factor A